MPAGRSGTIQRQIQALFTTGTVGSLADGQLLERFADHRDEAAFEALVERHGPMVLRVCRGVLADLNDADDAFQATFLVLVRRAGSIRKRDSLASWLFGIAGRVAARARVDAARRRKNEQAAARLEPCSASERDAPDPGLVLHEELARLPEKYREAVVLYYLEGRSCEEAALRLKRPVGTIKARLSRARGLLRGRLGRRGVALPAGLAAVEFNAEAAPLAVPPALVRTTIEVVTRSTSAVGASACAGALARGVLRSMLFSRLKFVAVAVLAGVAVAGSAVIARNAHLAVVVAQAHAGPAGDGPTMRVEGRILNLEGRPVAGATVSVKYLQSPPDGDLDAWIGVVKRLAKEPFGLQPVGWPGQGPLPSATTGRDGRFAIAALPRDAIATASISGPGIETSEVYILTRDVPTIRVKSPEPFDRQTVVYYGARFDHAAAPTRPVIGTVRDQDTGAPIAGVHITGGPNIPNNIVPTPGVEATTDAQGRFQITGLATLRGFKLFTEAPPGQPYVNCGFVSPAGEHGPGPVTFDMTLKRGVLVRGRLTDKSTGRPVVGSVVYYAFADNAHLDEYPNFKRGSQEMRVMTPGWDVEMTAPEMPAAGQELAPVVIPGFDGRFTIPALPGRGLIAARAQEERYLHGSGVGAIRGFDRSMEAFPTYPFYCMTVDKHVFAEINPAPGVHEIALEVQVDPGRTVKGTIVGPDGQPILDGGTEIRTLDLFQTSPSPPADSPTFVVTGLPAGRYRIDFIHRDRKLAGALYLKGDETGSSLTAAKLAKLLGHRGRADVIDEEGKPLTDVELSSTSHEGFDAERGDLENRPTVDARGRFRIEGLVPGVKYDADGRSPNKAGGPVMKDVQVASGEVKDLGDLKLLARGRRTAIELSRLLADDGPPPAVTTADGHRPLQHSSYPSAISSLLRGREWSEQPFTIFCRNIRPQEQGALDQPALVFPLS